ncbi:hypothetical protein V492_02955 [Pseudogymnoascus sp. VKM F-4246]|nr:hypothetical protein V492_02955 [Pseudogymnoascus sp. VKM F-4246]
MRGLLATALLAPALASALVVPNTWDRVVIGPPQTEISQAVSFSIPYIATSPNEQEISILGFEVDLAQSGLECGSGDLIVNGIPVPYGTVGALELANYGRFQNIQMKWDLTCGPLTRTLVFAVNSVNEKPVHDIGVTVLYSQDDTSLEILDIKKFSTQPNRVHVALSSDSEGLKIEEGPNPGAHPAPHGAQAPIAEKPSSDDANAIHGIALCNSAKCIFMVAVHNTKETAKTITSKVKSVFCHKKPKGSHPSKYHQAGHHKVEHHDEHDVMPGHDEEKPHHRPHHGHHRPHHGHKGKWHHVKKAAHPGFLFFFFAFFSGIMFRILRDKCRAKRAARHDASGSDDDEAPKRRRRCCGWRRRRCRRGKREYSEKDEVLPRTEANPAYSSPSHIATEIADLRHAAEAVEDIVSQSSEGSRYARRGSADTMETLPEYTAEETGSKIGSETLPGYTDSEESVSVADGYQPGTGEVWRARVDGVNVKV